MHLVPIILTENVIFKIFTSKLLPFRSKPVIRVILFVHTEFDLDNLVESTWAEILTKNIISGSFTSDTYQLNYNSLLWVFRLAHPEFHHQEFWTNILSKLYETDYWGFANSI